MFDYFYSQENEQYLFLQMPKILIKDPQFKTLSGDSKILYSLLLDRTSLSKKNEWTDDEGRVYIIYTLTEMMEDLNCYEQKALKSMKELKDIGLVKTVRRGLNKPNLIYVMNFATTLKYTQKSGYPQEESTEKSRNCDFRSSRNNENRSSGTVIFTVPELRKSQTINTYSNQTDSNQTESNKNQSIVKPVDNFQNKSDPAPDRLINHDALINTEKKTNKKTDETKSYNPFNQTTEELLREAQLRDMPIPIEQIAQTIENLHINSLINRNPRDTEQLTEIRNIIIDVLNSNKKEYKISDEIIPAHRIKHSFLQLTSDHIQYLLDSLNKTTSKIKNIKFYLIKSLYNAPLTFNNHLQQDVNYDLANRFGLIN